MVTYFKTQNPDNVRSGEPFLTLRPQMMYKFLPEKSGLCLIKSTVTSLCVDQLSRKMDDSERANISAYLHALNFPLPTWHVVRDEMYYSAL